MTIPVSSWGRLDAPEHYIAPLTQTEILPDNLGMKGLPFGNGRSYGDVCLNPGGLLWTTRNLDRFVDFNKDTGLLSCEAGILLKDIQTIVVPQGWMLPVTPGTQLVTVGGAIANDVHGKNHHVFGSFGDHVKSITLLRTEGSVIECGPEHEEGWFAATVGGMGLTGIVTRATLQLRRIEGSWVEVEKIPFKTLGDFFRLANESEIEWEHTVSWIDCLNSQGRGIFMRGNHVVERGATKVSGGGLVVPLVPPLSLVNKISLRPFNFLYYQKQAHERERKLVHYEPFFYPLDKVKHWNRIYGPKGFYQYQSVVPREAGKDATQAMLKAIARAGEGSFLAVLKTFGMRQSLGMMSFPMPGVTLALDFPNKNQKTLALLASLDDIVREAGGRIYAAKDSRMPRDLFEKGYSRLDEFVKYRDSGISSAMSRRLMGN